MAVKIDAMMQINMVVKFLIVTIRFSMTAKSMLYRMRINTVVKIDPMMQIDMAVKKLM